MAGLLPPEATPAVIPLAFSLGGFAQIIAGVLEYKNGNTFGMVAFTSYGAFWWWYAFLLWTVGAGWIKPPDPRGVGVALLMWGVFTLYMWIATFRTNFTLWTIFLLLWITFFLLAGADLGMGVAWKTLGGWFGLATASTHFTSPLPSNERNFRTESDNGRRTYPEVITPLFSRQITEVGGAQE